MGTQTIKKALQSMINYPLDEGSFDAALTRFGLDGNSLYSQDNVKALDICAAWLILIVCTSGNVSEGGYSLSTGDKASLLKTRSLIISLYPEENLDGEKATVSAGKGLW
jgi:hypothetical protein